MNMVTEKEKKLRQLRILFVEDNSLLREMFVAGFGDMHQLYVASDLKRGWDIYLEKSPNIVFMDIRLPDGTGHDLVRKIKEHNPATHIIMTTASRNIEDKIEAANNRADGYISKPFDKKIISQYIERYMKSCESKN